MADTGITSVHLDERDRSVVVSARHPGLPEDAPAEWREQGFDSYEEQTVYGAVERLEVRGWSHLPVTDWKLEELPDARRAVTLTGPGTSIRFTAAAPPARHRRGLRTGAF
ncbi:hypothetical protein FH609_008930 [Streptomyces sp. 3MP-14]|uniref:Uncharacterized protein n=1 Tax=Streptomyces mimosae TaxID=2586635 RepID=A0A5N6AI38_9ACTN|nr:MULTISPECIES: hypothetical protein [Streptomyces]KAB8168507.1 hypothetical protein FH607_004435 [Streptomyces mimosae]KAB8178212.1 hypothetical protein FH609_008930 [Streptomyces sp. 3MP-14]